MGGLDRPLEQLFDLLSLGMIGEKLEKVIKIIDRLFKIFDRRGEAAGVKPIAFLMVACGEVVEGEVEGVLVVNRAFLLEAWALESMITPNQYQSTIDNSATLENSPTFRVTIVACRETATPAIKTSNGPIGVPCCSN